MYRCEICKTTSKPGQGQQRWIVYRPDKSIDREYKVCRRCLKELEGGAPFATVVKWHGTPLPPLPKEPPPPPVVNQPVALGRPVKIMGRTITPTKTN